VTASPDPTSRLSGTRVLVTGGGSGIGRASCLRLAAEGAEVLVTDRDPDTARATAGEIVAAPGRGKAAQLDVADPDVESALTKLVAEHLGELDALVNNAGVGSSGTILETGEDDWRRLFVVNVDGVFRCSRAALPQMLERNRGTIVNVASVAGIAGLTNRFAYCATKGAVVSMTRAMALDYATTGVRVNCVCPGTIDTPWVESMAAGAPDRDAFRAHMAARQPVGRMGTAEEIAAAVAFLCSADSRFMTGAALVVDGGLTAGVPARGA
jgi:meso-butanediol dehydrogenase/(S,S)-butanediol dehydrogenase/diacetyl reductase